MSNGVEAYKATLKFIRSLLGLAFMGWLAWLVVPRLGGFFHWLGGLDKGKLELLVVGPTVAIVLIALFATYAVFFKGTGFVERIVNSETAREAVRGKKAVINVEVDTKGAEDSNPA